MVDTKTVERKPGYCALCWSSCGCISVIEDGRLTAVEPDPTHPTGKALCGKGQAAPELVYNEERLLYPMKRTRPKGSSDPGWERISWDEALDTTASEMKRIAEDGGRESVAFSITTSAGTAMQDGWSWVERLRQSFGTPNAVASVEICGYSKDYIYPHTFGVSLPMSDLEHSDCIILWGHNPGTTWLAHATRVADARKRGANLIVMDPLRAGFAAKADQWLRVRPSTDGALALCLAGILIDEGLFDRDFVRDWTNGPFLIRDDDDRFLTGADLEAGGDPESRVAWDGAAVGPVMYAPSTGTYERDGIDLAIDGRYDIATPNGTVSCRTAFDRYAELCRSFPPERTAEITWIPAQQILETARLIGASNAVCCYYWAGLEQQSNVTQTGRAVACLYALTGDFDARGGNVLFEKIATNDVGGRDLMPGKQREKSLGREKRSLGPERINGWITSDSFYDAVLKREPYGVDALVSFGMNMLLSHSDGKRGVEALEALDFMVHADLFVTPTASYADIVLPVNTPWEREGLKTDFYVDQKACGYVQYREQMIESRGESRSDVWIAFELAERLGLGNAFWGGDRDAGYREMLAPSGLDLDELRQHPAGVAVPLETHYRKYTEGGFGTPSKKVEFYSETLLNHGYPPLPEYVEPAMGPVSEPDLAEDFPLILTTAKSPHYLHSQFRALRAVRRHEREPRIDLHPETAAARDISEGDWVALTTPHGEARAKARFSKNLDPRVVRATHGWWQGCGALSLDGYDANSDAGANVNRVIGDDAVDPVGGCVPLKSYMCQIAGVSA